MSLRRGKIRRMFAVRVVLTFSMLGGTVVAQDWPMWRGPVGNGVASVESAPLTWSREDNVKWHVSLARPGNGSPIVSGDRVFLTMAEDEEGKRRSLLCFDRDSGELVWKRTVEIGEAMPTHKTNPHCSTTPATDGERVVVWHASAGLHCYDFAGKPIWSRELGEFRHEWGHGTSPLIHDGRVVLQTGPGEEAFVTVLDLDTGETMWRHVEPDRRTPEEIEKKRMSGSWCTPLVEPIDGRAHVLCGLPTRVVAYDVERGAITWSCGGVAGKRGDLTYSSPSVASGVCLIQGGWEGPSLGVRIDGKGDVTETHRVWRREGVMSNVGSGIAIGDHFYIPDMGSIVHCIEAKTGKTKWKKRVGRGSSWSSIVSAAGRLYLTNQRGTTHVFEPNPEDLVVLASNGLEEQTNSTPAIAGSEIFLRTHEGLWCIAVEK